MNGKCNTFARRGIEGHGGLWELLTNTNVLRSLVMHRDMRLYKRIQDSTHGHLTDNDRSGKIKSVRVPNYTDDITKLFPTANRR